PPMLVLTWSGLRAGARERAARRTVEPEREAGRTLGAQGWAAVVGAGIFLGFTATWYTLLVAYSAFTVGLMALLLAGWRWRRAGLKAALDPVRRLGVIAIVAAPIGATTWLPFVVRAASNPVSDSGSSLHYLP